MSILNRIRKASLVLFKKEIHESGTWRNFYSRSNGEHGGSPYITEYLAEYIGWTYANIKAIAQAVSIIDFKLMQKKGDEVDEVKEHQFLELLYRPNPFFTKSDFVKLLTSYLLMTGESPIRLKRNNPLNANELPSEMWLLKPSDLTVKVGQTKDMFEVLTGYEAKIDTKSIDLNPWEVVFINNPNPNDIWRGIGVIEAAAKTINSLSYSEDYNLDFFHNSARPDFVLATDQVLNDDSYNRLKAEIEAKHGTKNRKSHSPMLTEGGLKPLILQNTAKDMDFVEQQRFMRDKLMALFGTTKVILGITEDVNRANAEASEYVFMKNTVRPIMSQICEYLNEFLLPVFDKSGTMFLTFTDPVPENEELKVNYYDKAIGRWKTPNEIRALEGDAPNDDELADSLFLLKNGGESKEEPKPTKRLSEGQMNAKKYKEDILRLENRNLRRKDMIRAFKKLLKEIKGKPKYSNSVPPKYKSVKEKTTIDAFIKNVLTKSDKFEDKLTPSVTKYYDAQLKEIVKNLESTKAIKTKGAEEYLFDKETSVKTGLDLMTPIIEAIILEQGQEAFELLGLSKPYSLLEEARRYLAMAPEKSIKTMTNTAYERAREIISEGIKNGESIPQITKNIREEYNTLKTKQVQTVVRSEVSRATGFAQEDAYIQSGVVEGKEWVVTKDDRLCPTCSAMPVLYKDRLVRKLGQPFFKDGEEVEQVDPATGKKLLKKDGTPKTYKVDYGDVNAEPLHVRCRCVIIPVLEPIKSAKKQKSESEIRAEVIKEVEAEVYGRNTK